MKIRLIHPQIVNHITGFAMWSSIAWVTLSLTISFPVFLLASYPYIFVVIFIPVLMRFLNRIAYNEIEEVIQNNKLSEWTKESIQNPNSGKLKALHCMPPYNCTRLDVEGYLDIPELIDQSVFTNNVGAAFYQMVFHMSSGEISAVNFGNQDDLAYFVKQHYYNRGVFSSKWHPYVVHWVCFFSEGTKIHWQLDKAMIDDHGWKDPNDSWGNSDAFRDLVVKFIAEAYKKCLDENEMKSVKSGVQTVAADDILILDD
jgi:hypothetical protein